MQTEASVIKYQYFFGCTKTFGSHVCYLHDCLLCFSIILYDNFYVPSIQIDQSGNMGALLLAPFLLLAAIGQQAVLSLPSNTISVMSYNIMDSGFADASGKYDPVGDRVPGNLTNFMAQQSPFFDVLGRFFVNLFAET